MPDCLRKFSCLGLLLPSSSQRKLVDGFALSQRCRLRCADLRLSLELFGVCTELDVCVLDGTHIVALIVLLVILLP